MSDSYDDYESAIQLAEEIKEARHTFRTGVWTTKDGREIAIKDMDDRHLFNAYQHSQEELLFCEMVLRLFENRIKEKHEQRSYEAGA